MTSKRIISILVVSTVFLATVVAGAYHFWPRSTPRGSRPPPPPAPAAPIHAAEPSIYLQTDPRWGDDAIGGSGEKMAMVDCTVCCVSMALAEHGIDLDPGELNRRLKRLDGYTGRGWLKWDAVRQVTGGQARVRIPPSPSRVEIDAALRMNYPVIAKVRLASGIMHWILIVRRQDEEYLVKDPLGDGRHLTPLSRFGSGILAIRIVERVAGNTGP